MQAEADPLKEQIHSHYRGYEKHIDEISKKANINEMSLTHQYQKFSVRQKVRERLLNDIFKPIKQKAKLSADYIVLVVDDHASKLVSAFCTPYELMEYGSIYQVEKLSLQRKRYPDSDAIYIVDPMNKDSIKLIINDFLPDDQDSIPYDQYGHVHLCFTSNFLTDENK